MAAGVVAGMAGAALLTLAARAFHKRAVRTVVPEPQARDYLPEQERSLTLPLGPSQATEAGRGAVARLPRAGPVEVAADGRTIRARTSPGRRGLGEVVTVRIQPTPRGSRLTVSSVPRIRFGRYDFGANLRNVLLIEQALSSHPSDTELRNDR